MPPGVAIWKFVPEQVPGTRLIGSARIHRSATKGKRNADLIANGQEDRVKERVYTGKPTYHQQIWTSITTVFFGFLIASVIAIPLGIMAGLSVTALGVSTIDKDLVSVSKVLKM